MATVNIAGTATLQTSVSATLYRPEYLWCMRRSIQRFLDQESVISIGAIMSDTVNYDEEDAEEMENGVVRMIINYLSFSLEISIDTENEELKEIAAMMTAGRIGLARMGSSMGNQPAAWTVRLANDGWARLQQMFISQTLLGVTAKDVSLALRLINAKTRQRTMVNVTN